MSLPDIDTGVYAKLSTDSDLAAWAGTYEGLPNIWEGLAPEGVTLPYVVFYDAVTDFMNDSPRQMSGSVYRVEAVAASRTAAHQGAAYIFAALHMQELSLTGFGNYWMAVVRQTNFTPNDVGQVYYRRILDVEIGLTEEEE